MNNHPTFVTLSLSIKLRLSVTDCSRVSTKIDCCYLNLNWIQYFNKLAISFLVGKFYSACYQNIYQFNDVKKHLDVSKRDQGIERMHM